jgi:hypothetical protein
MQCGFNHALYSLEEFWEFYGPVIKAQRLANYKGVKYIIRKLIEKRREFFIKGKDADIFISKAKIESFYSDQKGAGK